MEFYNTKTRELTLVKDVKGEELITESYSYPIFVKGVLTQRAIELGAELEKKGFGVDAELFEGMTTFIVELYGKQFTREQLINGIDIRQHVDTYVAILFGALQGDPLKNE